MKRRGKYTKQQPFARQGTNFVSRKWKAFRALSKKKQAAIIGGPIAAFLILTPIITYLLLARDISDPERLMNRNNTGVQLLDQKGKVFFSSGNSKPLKRLPLSKISNFAEKAAVSSEDKDFYKNNGISITGILGAVYANVTNKDLTAYGGSTITQQLVKNTLLTNKKTFFRKYQEVALAVAIDRQYSKDQILDFYLNSVYYGENAFGIDEAAKTYFNTSAQKLDLAQSAMLIGLLPAPSAYSPISGDRDKAKRQQERVLRRLMEDGKITAAQQKAAAAEKLSYAPPKAAPINDAPHFTEMILSELNERYGEEKVQRSGYRIRTTLNLKWQREAEENVKKQVAIISSVGGRNASLVAIDPKNGEVRALVGSSDYNNPKFGKVNMATTARQPGSSFKPIYYTEALNKGLITGATVLQDEPKDFGGYKPNNFDFAFRGDIRVRDALPQSLNIPAVEVMQKLGVDKAVAKAREMGLSTIKADKDYGLSLALGSAEVKPLELTNAYAAFANQGQQYQTTLIKSIKNKYGEQIFTSEPKSKQVQTASASFVMSDILDNDQARAPTFGDRLNIPGKQVAVKTGSTDDDVDAWTMGYTPDVAVGVWVGNNEHQPMSGLSSGLAGPIWRNSITEFLQDLPNDQFSPPGDVVKQKVCSGPGGTYTGYFISGTQPNQNCDQPKAPDKPKQETKPTKPPEQPKPEPAPLDSDNDGIIDSDDSCPNTPPGASVDQDGCEIVTEPADGDGDGVPDSTDACPATPAGTPVMPNGCAITPPSGMLIGPESKRYA